MTPGRWQAIERIFGQASGLPPAERSRVLAGVDVDLREEVEQLLAADLRGGRAVAAAVEEGRGIAAPRRFGPYRVTGLAGRGGMGAVFAAVRDDGAFEKHVAIKVMHTGSDVARFRQERAILAALDHPSIARLLDGGETETGVSYIVLEFVDGVPLLEYCRQEGLSTAARLRLFLAICSAVQYAHQNLVVHRDLKPDNVLVTRSGEPKLLDFGIAKLLDNDPSRTTTMVQALTPHYASPEQLRGGAISAATDVYSLGVILYELLTGRRPYEFPSPAPADVDRTVCETAPAPPGLSADLDNILLKALRKEPGRRYASVQQLADDIVRSLEHRPVLARPDTLRYRSARFLRRNWHRLGLASVMLGAMVAVSGMALRQAQVARQRFDQVRSLANRFLFDFETQISDVPGTTRAREMVVATALEYLNDLAADAGGDPVLMDEIAQAYEKTAEVLWRPGLHGLGRPKDAVAALKKSLAIYEQLLRRKPGDEHLQTQAAAAQIRISDLQNELRRCQEAQAGARAALERLAPLRRARPGDAALRKLEARAWRAQGLALSFTGQSGAALEPLQRAAAAMGALAGGDDPELRRSRLVVLSNLGEALERRGRLGEALREYERSIAEIRELRARDPNSAHLARMLLFSYRQKSGVLGNPDRPNLGRRAEALEAAERSLEIAQALFQADRNDALAAHEYAIAQGKIADLLGESDPRRALELNRRAITIVRNGAMGDYRERLSVAYRLSVMEPLRVLGRTAESAAGLRQAEPAALKLLAASPEDVDLAMDVADLYRGLGDIDRSEGNRAAAAGAYQRALRILEPAARVKPDFIRIQYHLARLYGRLAANAGKNRDEELRWALEAVYLWRRWVARTPDSAFGREQLRAAESRIGALARQETLAAASFRPAVRARR